MLCLVLSLCLNVVSSYIFCLVVAGLEAAMCKAKAGRAGTLITQKCCDLLGPLGFSQDYLAEKWMRDVKITDIFEGTGQIMHRNIAREILGVKIM